MSATATADGRSLFYSGGLHLALLIFAIFGLPDLFDTDHEPEPIVVTLMPLPISSVSNVKPVDAPIIKPPPKPLTPAKAVKPTPPVKQTQPKPKENPVKMPTKDKAPEKKAEEKPKEKPQTKDELDAILESVRKDAQQVEDKKAPPKPAENVPQDGAISEKYNPTLPLSISDMDAIKSQVAPCWRMPAGAENDYTLVVTLNIQLNADGSLLKVEPLMNDRLKAASSPAFRMAMESAMRAISRCTPLKDLPSDKYDSWKDFDMVFDPKNMLY